MYVVIDNNFPLYERKCIIYYRVSEDTSFINSCSCIIVYMHWFIIHSSVHRCMWCFPRTHSRWLCAVPAEPFTPTGCQSPLWIRCIPYHHGGSAGIAWWVPIDYWSALWNHWAYWGMTTNWANDISMLALAIAYKIKTNSQGDIVPIALSSWNTFNSKRSNRCGPGACAPCFTWQLLSGTRCFSH